MNEQESTKTNINWYPGHMAKTKRQIIEDLKLIDVVIELLDARIPMSSRNPDIMQIIKNKKKIIVLNKIDLADENKNKMWEEKLKKQGENVVLIDSVKGIGIRNVISKIEQIMKDELQEYAKKGRTGRKIRIMILGIPNVGKSSLINKIAGKVTMEVGNRPGVTRNKQWIRVNDKIELQDTPGVLWPKFQDEQVALNLAYTGTIKDDILDKVEIAYNLLKYMLYNYRENICNRYKITNEYIESTLAKEEAENINIYEIMQTIGKKRGAIISGGKIDDEKTAKLIIEDFRSGKLGRITLE